MEQGMYSAVFGALTQEHRLDIIANNLANVDTPGYKPDRLAFEDTFIKYAHDEIREPILNARDKPLFPQPHYLAKSRIALSKIDFGQGSLEKSDNPLDLAISGDGFFKIRTPEGDFYTRAGNFMTANDGRVINAQGHLLVGDGGVVAVPPGSNVEVRSDGAVLADGDQIDTIPLFTFDNLNALEKLGHNLFRLRSGSSAEEIAPEDASIVQGFVEKPNVEIVSEMVNMIEAQRAYEAYTKMIQTSEANDKKAMQKVGETR